MKVVLSFLLLIGLSAGAQDKAKKPSLFERWPALKEFHAVMSGTFHPSEEGNLEPIKTRSGEMVSKAESLAKSEIPKDLNKEKIKSAVDRLVSGSKELDKMIRSKVDDGKVKESLAKLHDVFHEIVGLCRDEH